MIFDYLPVNYIIFRGDMLSFDLYNYYQANKRNNILLTFKGSLSQEILVEMGAMIKNKLKIDRKLKKIFAVFVEMSQNIMHYSEEKEYIENEDKMVGAGIIVFTESPAHYLVTSGNLISRENSRKLTKRIDSINKLQPDELKTQYQKQLRSPMPDDAIGAGLGLYEIRRKASDDIFYRIAEAENGNEFIEISAKIDKGG
jgi:hypothetical protein